MSFFSFDIFGGAPVELYTFSISSKTWRYTSADEDKTVNLQTYKRIPIKRPKISSQKRIGEGSLTLSNIDLSAEFLQLFRGAPSSEQVQFTLSSYHEVDPDQDIRTLWSGVIVDVKFSEKSASIECQQLIASTRQPVITRHYQTSCPYVLYGGVTSFGLGCGVNSATFRTSTSVNAINGKALSLSSLSQADGFFSGGYIEWNNGSFFESRFIVDHQGVSITLDLPFQGINGGDLVRVYPGCDHTLQTCHNKFNNVDNYGGQPFSPDKNPMSNVNVF